MKKVVSLLIAAVLAISGSVCYAADGSMNTADVISDNNAGMTTGTEMEPLPPSTSEAVLIGKNSTNGEAKAAPLLPQLSGEDGLLLKPTESNDGLSVSAETDDIAPLVEGDVEINEANFPDANFRNWLLAKSYGADGILEESEIADIWDLHISGLSIADLTGIEYFTELSHFYCDNNKLTTLDMSGNPALEVLMCDNNNLTALNVSKNLVLDTLICKNNNLTVLDVSKNLALGFLDCDNNNLTALDVSRNANLDTLYCQSNALIALDLSGNPVLSELRCDNNNLTALNLSGNPEMAALHCNNNKLATLDLSKNPAFRHIYCDNNHLTVLDVSGSAILLDLRCNNNNLTVLDVSKNPTLAYFECAGNVLTTLDISKNPQLNTLDCSRNALTVLDALNNPMLFNLNCNSNALTTLDVSKTIELCLFNCSNNALTALDLSQNTYLTVGNSYYYCDHNPIRDLKLPSGEKLIVQNAPSNGGKIMLTGFDYASKQTTYSASPEGGYTFAGWTGDASGAAPELSFGLSGNMTVTANFSTGKNVQTPNIIAQPQNKIVHVGEAALLKVSASVSDGGTLSYQWYSNTQNKNTGGMPISGAVSASYLPPTDTVGTTYYYVLITNTNNKKTAASVSNPAAVTVKKAYTEMEPGEIVDEVKDLDPSKPDDREKLEKLENIYKDKENVTVKIEADPNTHGDFKNLIDKISVVGAAFSANPGETITLHFSKPINNVVIDGNRYKTNNVVQFDIKLMNGVMPLENLNVPVTITVPIPSGVEESNFWILHYHNDGSYEVIVPKLNGDGTCTFTVTNFSVFVFVNGTETDENGGSSSGGSDSTSVNTASADLRSLSGAPRTGDEASVIGWMLATAISAAALSIVLLLHRKFSIDRR